MRDAARAAGILAVVATITVSMPGGTALAHASVADTSLADGSVVDEAPEEITISFDEAVLVTSSSVTLVHVVDGETEVLAAHSADEGSSVVVTMPELADGGYLLRFGVVDPADLHRTVGSISFGIGSAAPPSEPGRQLAVPLWSSVARALGDGGLLLGVGCATMLIIGGLGLSLVDRRRIIRWSVAAAVAQVTAWVFILLIECSTIGWTSVSWSSVLLGSEPGRRVVIGAQVAAGLWWVTKLPVAVGASERSVARVVVALWTMLLVLASIGGHTGIGGSVAVGVMLRWVHLAALGGWIGSVAVAALLQRGRRDRRLVWNVVNRCSTPGLALTGVTGLLLSGRLVENITALLSTRSGWLIVVKLAGLPLLALFGLMNARRVVRQAAPRRGVLLAELVLGATLVVVAAGLAGSPPAVGEQFRPLPDVAPQLRTTELEDLVVNASVEPALPGANLVSVSVLDTRRPAPGEIAAVRVIFTDVTGVEVSSAPVTPVDGHADVGGLVLPEPGSWTMTIEVDRPASPVPSMHSTVEVLPAPMARVDTVVSNRRWAPLALGVALAWGVLVWIASRLVPAERRRAARRAAPASLAGRWPREAHDGDAAVVDLEELLELEARGSGEATVRRQHDEACAGV